MLGRIALDICDRLRGPIAFETALVDVRNVNTRFGQPKGRSRGRISSG
jgi:hypothetical protein